MQYNGQTQFQGNHLPRIPQIAGLYAWYYKPLIIDEQTINKILFSFLNSPGDIYTEIELRYGIRLTSKTTLDISYGSQLQSATEVLNTAIACADSFFIDFFKSQVVEIFTKPIYIGIAQNLYKRVYGQHYLALTELWDDASPISKYLINKPDATVQLVMEKLNLSHSFALEARVRGIAPRDLIAHIYPTNSLPANIGPDSDDSQTDNNARRALERLLQLVVDPICGRR